MWSLSRRNWLVQFNGFTKDVSRYSAGRAAVVKQTSLM